MSDVYNKAFSEKKTSQGKPIPGREEDMVKNSAGGYTFAVDMWTSLERFLILGSASGTYYVSPQELTEREFSIVRDCVRSDPKRVLDMVYDISINGRAPKQEPCLVTFAYLLKKAPLEVRKEAWSKFNEIVRIGTHLFTIMNYLKNFGGFGRLTREGIAKWYTDKKAAHIAFQALKYQQREGWSHFDVLRVAHPTSDELGRQAVLRYIITGSEGLGEREVVRPGRTDTYPKIPPSALPDIVPAFEAIHRPDVSAKEAVALINKGGLTWEMVPTELLRKITVWEALIPNIGMSALIRNLGRLSNIEYIKANSKATADIISRITNEEAIKKSRIHPMQILVALATYSSGKGLRGSLSWTPNQRVVDALDKAFYMSFGNVTPTGKSIQIACDISGSMRQLIAGTLLSAKVATAAMALITANVESNYVITGFTSAGRSGGIDELKVSPRMRLDQAISEMHKLPFGGTDCALPMLWATQNKLEFDAFEILTDNETWAGNVHPRQALEEYRHKFSPNAKLITVAMTPNAYQEQHGLSLSGVRGGSISDPDDPLSMDVVGFDTNAPQVISDFISK